MKVESKANSELIEAISYLKQRISGMEQFQSEIKDLKDVLQDNEIRYRSLFETCQDSIFIINQETERFVSVNNAACRLYGYSANEFYNMKAVDISAEPEDTSLAIRDSVITVPMRLHLKKDGTVFPVEITGGYFFLNGSKFHTAIIRDITERVKSEELLKESEEKYRVLLNNDRSAICIINLDTMGFIDANDAHVKLYGYTRDELLNHKKTSDLTAEPEETLKAIELAAKQNSTLTVPLRWHKKADGTIFPIEAILWPHMLNNARVLFAMVFDISERVKAEELLKQTQQNYDAFFNAIDDFIFVLDEQGNIMHVNDTVLNRLGYAREELTGKPVLMVHPTERVDEANKIIGDMLDKKAEFCPIPVITKSGIQIPVETRVSRGNWDGKPALFGVTKDISKIKLSEEKFSKVFHLNPSACGLSDLQSHKYIELNEAFYKLFGFTEVEVIGKTPLELGIMTPETRNSILLKSDSNGKITNAEAELMAKNGEIKHVLLSAENIYVQDKKYRFTIAHDITGRKQTESDLERHREHLEDMIRERTAELGMKTMALEQANIALKVLLQHREYDKNDMEEKFVMNLRNLIAPYIEELKKSHLEKKQRSLLDTVELHLNEIVSPMLKNMQQFNLTPRETKVASLIKQDKSTKEISEVLKISVGSVDVHRKNIRKKLGLTNRRESLSSFMQRLEK
jgi:PAS domain S-box-containing protein